MSTKPEPSTVTIRDLNNGASAVINRVHDTGVPVIVTNHGKPWVKIVPLQEALTPYERLLQMGHVKPRRNTRPFSFEPVKIGRRSEEVLDELREGRF